MTDTQIRYHGFCISLIEQAKFREQHVYRRKSLVSTNGLKKKKARVLQRLLPSLLHMIPLQEQKSFYLEGEKKKKPQDTHNMEILFIVIHAIPNTLRTPTHWGRLFRLHFSSFACDPLCTQSIVPLLTCPIGVVWGKKARPGAGVYRTPMFHLANTDIWCNVHNHRY